MGAFFLESFMTTVTIYDATSFPVRYKRVDKPRIRRNANAIWVCSDIAARGFAYSPAAAYACWVRNHFIGSPRD